MLEMWNDMPKDNWDRDTMRFVSVGHLARQSMIAVTFANGDHFLIATESVLASPANGSKRIVSAEHAPVWSKLRIGETGDVIEVPVGRDVVEIPWDRIRSIADPDFRAHLADHAEKRARLMGV